MGDIKVGNFTFRTSPFLRPEKEYARRKDTKHLVVHCSATKREWDGGVDEIREWHVTDNHWMDVGYHFVIRRDGTIERGRPTWSVGAGVEGHNASAIHICLAGGIDANGKAEDNFEGKQKAALAFLLANLLKEVAPDAEVLGHRDFPNVKKDCPSFNVKRWWYGDQYDSTQARAGWAFGQYVLDKKLLN